MNEPPATTEADRIQEELVAYLDGELDAAESDRVERRLADDPAYRNTLKELQAAWDLLDELPRTPVTESFTQTTVEMVALTAEEEVVVGEQQLQRRQRWQWVALAGAVALAAVGSFFIMSSRLDRPNQELVKDLPVIERVEQYRVAESVDFLRELEKARLFNEEQHPDEP
jgi:anti-sigma factor RsiW